MSPEAERIIERLGLRPHPEGGYYRETFRAALTVSGIPHGERSASTAIYFLLSEEEFSAFHRVRSDEVWHHYGGTTLELHLITPDGTCRVERLGRGLASGEQPQIVVPAGVWQAAAPIGSGYTLCGCTVAPGFDFADFEMPSREELVSQFPQHQMIVSRLSRPAGSRRP